MEALTLEEHGSKQYYDKIQMRSQLAPLNHMMKQVSGHLRMLVLMETFEY